MVESRAEAAIIITRKFITGIIIINTKIVLSSYCENWSNLPIKLKNSSPGLLLRLWFMISLWIEKALMSCSPVVFLRSEPADPYMQATFFLDSIWFPSNIVSLIPVVNRWKDRKFWNMMGLKRGNFWKVTYSFKSFGVSNWKKLNYFRNSKNPK